MDSSFQVAICECPDVVASTLAVDVTGRYTVISGRKNIILVDLNGENIEKCSDSSSSKLLNSELDNQRIVGNPSKIQPVSKRMVRNSKYEPTASQFNRLMKDLFALTAYQVAEVFSIEDLNPAKPKLLLRGHSRAIADLEWSQFDPYLLGTSAADCLTNLWDIRDSRRPSASLTSVSAATQIRFSKTSSNLIATSHDIDVRIWDIRQPNLPLYYIAAHLQKINGMDWSTNRAGCGQEQLITCSQDNFIKLWDLGATKVKPSANLATRTPAWRIRYTPISPNAILTSTLPQLRSRAECTTLKLWSLKPNRFEQKKLEPILNLVGHSDVIVDFDWRVGSTLGCEIVSLSKDQTLRVWKIDNQLIEMNVDNSDYESECGVQDNACESLESSSLINDNYTSTDSRTLQSGFKSDSKTEESFSPIITDQSNAVKLTKYSHDSNVATNESDSDLDDISDENLYSINELKQEFNLINKNIPNIEFEELNSLRRVCLVTARAKSVTCRLRIALPPTYPQNDCPNFTIIDSNQYGTEGLNKENKEKLYNLLNETAKAQLSRSRNCIEPCLRKFIAALQKIASHNSHRKRNAGSNIDYKDDPITLSAQRDHSIPFPNTCGAKFCGNLLVCFGRPLIPTVNTLTPRSESASWLVETPRSMAQLSAQLDNMRRQGSYNLSNISISYFYYGAMRRAEIQNRNRKNSPSNLKQGSSVKYLSGRTKSSAQSIISKSFKCGPVLIYDVSSLLGGLSRELAENYIFDRDVIRMCRKNAEIAATFNRRDLVQIWSLAELSSEGVLNSYLPKKFDDTSPSLVNYDSDFGDRPWTMHPFGSKLIQSLIDHYVHNCQDVQTAAMLVWTFSSSKLSKSVRIPSNSKSSSINAKGSFSQTTAQSQQQFNKQAMDQTNLDLSSDEWSFVNGPNDIHFYSNSWSNSIDVQNQNPTKSSKNHDCNSSSDSDDRFVHLNILSSERSLQNDLIMHIYSELLYRLKLLNQRAMVLKNIGSNSSYSEIFGDKQICNLQSSPKARLSNLTIQCYNTNCRFKCQSAQCPNCKKYSLHCSICRLPVKGSCSICLKCLHGGHINHYKTWFSTYDFCPTGCGCNCLSVDC